MMNGELAYKDIHGRVWRIQNRTAFRWTAETLDVGHTIHHHMMDALLENVLASIDREEFTTDDRSTRPLKGTEGREFIAEASGETSPERIEEIRRNAGEVNGYDLPVSNPLERFEERDE